MGPCAPSSRDGPSPERGERCESLARAARLRGDEGAAISHYRALLGLKDGSLGFEPQQEWLAAHYWLAGLYRARGDAALARETLTPLLAAWRSADPDLPLLIAARSFPAP